MKMSTKEVCIQGLLVALVAVSTMIFQIPVSATQGYIHLGDSMILLISVFFGARYGMVAGGVGSALADILSGYAHWALFTFIIKGIMGYLIGKVASFSEKNEKFITYRNMLASVLGIIWMVFGYFIGGGILKSSFAVAAVSIPENIIQGFSGFAIFVVVGIAFHRAKIYKYVLSR
ncbi:ECF transporter S component [Anaerotignum sp. MB30-C6]|uniref:ECF transporter S component n=1 Tax=Anaerotignum sp. MB30-C6 TaxID=3070814 RepID=UPI0027DBCFC6|nr:ECF transporter S component [Anaerotignum sp. MB30-C6]WMI81042.1 ECF transporter S component [Anaerotignum sp. MB30-C6]